MAIAAPKAEATEVTAGSKDSRVLVRGGGRVPDRELLERTAGVLASGASGIVYGRNIIQHANPAGMTRALMSLVHEGATAVQAARFLA